MCGRFQPLIEYLSEVYEALSLGASDMPSPSDKAEIRPTNAYPVIIERDGKAPLSKRGGRSSRTGIRNRSRRGRPRLSMPGLKKS